MKKKLLFFILLVLTVGYFVGGKIFIDKYSVNIEQVVGKSLGNYYVTSNIDDLKPIGDLLDRFSDNDEKVFDVQQSSFNVVLSWFNYNNATILCEHNKLYSCTHKKEVFKNDVEKLQQLYTYTGEKGDTILTINDYEELLSTANRVVNTIK